MTILQPLRTALLAVAIAAGSPAFAGDVSISRSYDLSADPAKTWGAISDWGGAHTWHPAIEKTTLSKGSNNQVGTVRVLALKGGGEVTETLTAYSAADKSMSYTIDGGPLPVAQYQATIAVKPGRAGGSTLVWSSNFKAKDGTPDADAKKTIEDIYDMGGENLKKQLGG